MARNILLVDDHSSNLRLSEMAVSAAFNDYHVHRAETYIEGAALLHDLDVDVALVDIELPDGNGLHIAQEVRAKSPEALVIILSVRDERDYFDMAYRAGADAYITKPYNMQDVLELIQELNTRPVPADAPDRTMWVLYGSHGLSQYRAAV